MGTGGTISGTGKYLKEKKPSIRIVGVDPIGSVYHDYFKTGKMPAASTYRVEGFGEDFLPSTMNLNILDEIVQVDDKECFIMTRELVRREGISVGGSGGAAVLGALKYARTLKQPKRLLVLLPDSSTKYLSKIFNDDWMRQNGFLDEDEASGYVAHILKRKPGRTITATRDTSVRVAMGELAAFDGLLRPAADMDPAIVAVLTEVHGAHGALAASEKRLVALAPNEKAEGADLVASRDTFRLHVLDRPSLAPQIRVQPPEPAIASRMNSAAQAL